MTIDTKRLREAITSGSHGSGSVTLRRSVVIALIDEIERLRGMSPTARVFDYAHQENKRLCEQLAAANAEIERLRAPKPLTEAEIVGALAAGRIERKCAEGDHAWASLVERNQTFVEQLAAMTAARDEACDLAEEANGDPSSCSHNVMIGERIAELRKVGG